MATATNAKTQADIAVLQTELKHMSELVERNHRDAQVGKEELRKDIKALAASIDALTADLNQRRGVEKWLIGLGSGSAAAALIKLIPWFGAAPR